ncbi:hypothetical protein L228DRAFT_239525 [Xylona heveae TC161]|uniref:BTB domain-containing protein n=1 Tax=Xylona heveae (strain CBS 132557 / TC161) TaxID=1328760 RepID=A0A165FZ90_XYLHT|nr:hypothetical protein L228DRAFT_239525 [Xylona heveae TC161]KZF21558.1 hypothetical protein L228DRAFT_239525 [Xylona heveae TC161]
MSTPEINILAPGEATPTTDVEMTSGDAPTEATATAPAVAADPASTTENTQETLPTEGNDTVSGEKEETSTAPPARVTFLDYLKSPIVELSVGQGDALASLTAHEALLKQSPYFLEACAKSDEDEKSPRRIDLPDEDLDAVGCFLEYIYTGEYFPRKVGDTKRRLEEDTSAPDFDEDGSQMLKHARVLTLAEKLGMPQLKRLAHSKIHYVQSTARGEIAYARYIYANTAREDAAVRTPVAKFWATRSHILRHEAESEFRNMCLEYPQFAYDVLELVLEAKEHSTTAAPGPATRGAASTSGLAEGRERRDSSAIGPGSARKRARHQG